MTLSIIGLVALVAYSSINFALFFSWASLDFLATHRGDPEHGQRCGNKAMREAVLCGLSFFGALALLGSLL